MKKYIKVISWRSFRKHCKYGHDTINRRIDCAYSDDYDPWYREGPTCRRVSCPVWRRLPLLRGQIEL